MWVEFDLSLALIAFSAATDVLRLGFHSPKKPTSFTGLVKPRRNGGVTWITGGVLGSRSHAVMRTREIIIFGGARQI